MSHALHLGIWASHPIQYYVPWFRHLARRLDIEVFYAHRQDARGQADAGFGVEFQWDIPLLDGYPHRWLANLAARPSVRSFRGCNTPEINHIVATVGFDAFLLLGWNHKSALQTIRACWRHRIPVLMRGDSQLQTPRLWTVSMLKFLPYRYFLPRLQAHLYVGARNKCYLQHYGVREEQLFFAPHFVDNAYFIHRGREAERSGSARQLRAAFGIPPDAYVVLFVGKLLAKKRPADMIRACLSLCARVEGAKLHALIVGDGPLRSTLEQMARSQSQRIHFAGFRNQTQLPIFYQAANALVLPSDGRETWGLVVNEAAASGLPAIVSDAVGCAPDMIDPGHTGYTYPVGNVEALAARMLSLKSRCEKNPTVVRRALTEKVACYAMERATQGLHRALQMVAAGKALGVPALVKR